MPTKHETKKIVVLRDGPYCVYGGIPLVRKDQVVSEYREPLTWEMTGVIDTAETYTLCRCGCSKTKPFCDGSHTDCGFDGTETADTKPTGQRQITFPGGTGIVVTFDTYLCTGSGFCANRTTGISGLVHHTGDVNVRIQVISMVDHCPSGALVYAMDTDKNDIEPDLPAQIAVTTEVPPQGRLDGPLWVTGNIPVERSDGEPFEIRNRVTLCSCGRSEHKPLCDGSHRHEREGYRCG